MSQSLLFMIHVLEGTGFLLEHGYPFHDVNIACNIRRSVVPHNLMQRPSSMSTNQRAGGFTQQTFAEEESASVCPQLPAATQAFRTSRSRLMR